LATVRGLRTLRFFGAFLATRLLCAICNPLPKN
jgi:hypothetical protein